MSYGLQIRNAAGDMIFDTDERFTRILGSYANNVLTGTYYTNLNSKYIELLEFTQDVSVTLPAGVQSWTPLLTKASQAWYISQFKKTNTNISTLQGQDQVYQLISGAYASAGYFCNIPLSMLDITGIVNPLVTLSAITISGNPFVHVSWRYMAGLTTVDGYLLTYTARRLTYDFSIVGY